MLELALLLGRCYKYFCIGYGTVGRAVTGAPDPRSIPAIIIFLCKNVYLLLTVERKKGQTNNNTAHKVVQWFLYQIWWSTLPDRICMYNQSGHLIHFRDLNFAVNSSASSFGRSVVSTKQRINQNENVWGGSPGLVVMGGDSCFKSRRFESQHRILDGDFHIY